MVKVDFEAFCEAGAIAPDAAHAFVIPYNAYMQARGKADDECKGWLKSALYALIRLERDSGICILDGYATLDDMPDICSQIDRGSIEAAAEQIAK